MFICQKNISDEQLYELDLLPLKMTGLRRMTVKKGLEKKSL